MRIGELLLESEIVNSKQLSDALHYARAKELPLGRCLKILRLVTDHDLERALEVQKLIRNGLDAKVGAQVLNIAIKHGLSVRQALMDRSRLKNIKVDPIKTAAVTATFEIEEETYVQIPVHQAKSAFLIIQEADRLFAEEKVSDAERKYIEAKDQLLKEHGHECTEVASCLVKIAHLYMSTDRYDEAEKLYADVLQSYTYLKGPDDPLVAKSFEDLGDLNQARGKAPQAADYFMQAYEIVKKGKPLDIGLGGRLLKKLCAVSKPTPECKRKKLGEFCADSGILMLTEVQYALKQARASGKPLGTVLRDERFLKSDQIESLMLAQLLTKKGVMPYDVAVQALSLSHICQISLKHICEVGRIVSDHSDDKVLVLEQDNLLTAERLLGSNHLEVAYIAERLPDLYSQHDDATSAIVFYRQAQNIYEKANNKETSEAKTRMARLLSKYARTLANDKHELEAEPLLMQALDMMGQAGKSKTLEAAECLHQLAQIHIRQHTHVSALSFFNSASALYEQLGCDGAVEPVFQEMLNLQLANDLNNDAEATLTRLINWAQRHVGPGEPETAQLMEQLGDLYQKLGRVKDAHCQYNFAMQIYERASGCKQKHEQLDKKLTASETGH